MTIAITMSLPNGFDIIPFTSSLLLKRHKYFPSLVSAIYLITLTKLKPKIFELKCISSEYFEDLIFRDNCGIRFKKEDIKSCALVSVNSLAALSATSESWIKLKKFEDNPGSKQFNEEVEECYKKVDKPIISHTAEANEKNENCYLIRCCGSSFVPKDFVFYVTTEKYFNILKHFGVNVIENLTFKISAEKSNVNNQPQVAKHVVLGCIVSDMELDMNNLERILKKYFEIPKYLKNSEVFQINLKKMSPVFTPSSENFSVENVYFKVLGISGEPDSSGNPKEDDIGYYIVEKHSRLIIGSKVQSFVYPLCKKYVRNNRKIGYEISICPGGLEKYYSRLRKLFKLLISNEKLQLKPLILLTGLKGSGKSTIIKCVTLSFGINLFTLNCFDLIGLEGSSLDLKYKDLTLKLRQMTPCVLLLENVELLGRNNQYQEDVTSVDQFQKFVEGVFKKKLKFPFIVVASTNLKDSELIPSIKRMFVETVAFEALKTEEAFALLNWLVKELGMTCFPEILNGVSKKLNGYLFADVTKLMRLAVKYQREDRFEPDAAGSMLLRDEHFNDAIRVVDSLYTDSIGSAKIPSVHWEDVGGLADVKEGIMTALNMTLKHPEFASTGLKCSGFLLHGPPGTGKTLMAKAVATECNCNFLSVKGPELINMYVGQSERNVREVFQRARNAAPCIIFFDELDSLAPNRGKDSAGATDRIVSQLLTEMDGLQSNNGVFIIGATNRPDLVDPALLRPGRFDKKFHVGVCRDKTAKLNVIKALTKRFSLSDDVDLTSIVEEFPEEVTGADIYSVCSNAWLETARRSILRIEKGEKISLPLQVSSQDFRHALDEFVPSLTPDAIEYYKKFRSLDH